MAPCSSRQAALLHACLRLLATGLLPALLLNAIPVLDWSNTRPYLRMVLCCARSHRHTSTRADFNWRFCVCWIRRVRVWRPFGAPSLQLFQYGPVLIALHVVLRIYCRKSPPRFRIPVRRSQTFPTTVALLCCVAQMSLAVKPSLLPLLFCAALRR